MQAAHVTLSGVTAWPDLTALTFSFFKENDLVLNYYIFILCVFIVFGILKHIFAALLFLVLLNDKKALINWLIDWKRIQIGTQVTYK